MTKLSSRSAIVPIFPFDRRGREPFYKQIFDGYRAAILDGRLRPGQRIPSTRELARDLGISRLPVLTACEQLLHEGYIVTRAGAGTFVTSSIPAESSKPPAPWSDGPPNVPRRAGEDRRNQVFGTSLPATSVAAFRVSLPALDHFPRKTWARLVSRHVRHMSPALMAYGEPAGYVGLRAAIADYLRVARAVRCETDQILVVSGSQMALQLCARVLLNPGDEVFVEEPGYPGARIALAGTGATVRPVPVDSQGLIVDAIAGRSRTVPVVYVTPSHQYPLGVSMSASRRLELLEWARRHKAWIIEDDYDSEYRFASRPLAALQGMDRASRVIYIGTFSKVLFPSLRVGYLVAPPQLIDSFLEHRDALDLFPATLYQMALTDFLTEGHFARHLRRMRAVYVGRRDALVAGIRRLAAETLTIVNSDAGMHLTAWLPPKVDDQEIVRRAAARGIDAVALSTCYVGTAKRMGLVLGFGGVNEVEIENALQGLVAVIRRCRNSPTS